MDIKIYYWRTNVLDIKWIEFKKNQIIGSYEINKISLPCVDDKTYIQNNGR